MPVYPFTCPTCKTTIEAWQKYTDPAPVCVTCALPMARQIGEGTDFILKGGGWYGKARFSPPRGPLSRKNGKNK